MIRRSRASVTQREKLLAFMMAQPDLAKGRVVGIDAARRRVQMLDELTNILNSMGTGCTKTPEKWWKCWQDWRSDTKAKALKLRRYRSETGGGPSPAPLSKLEESLLQFCGVEMEVKEEVPDPLQQTEPEPYTCQASAAKAEVQVDPATSDTDSEDQNEAHATDPLLQAMGRQAAAMERLADGMYNMANSIENGASNIAAALNRIADVLGPQNKNK